jgi:hypothetical protein
MATSFSGGRSRSTLREPPTMGKQLVNFITCGIAESGVKHQKSNQIKSSNYSLKITSVCNVG